MGLEILTSSLTYALPRFIGDRVVLDRIKDYARRSIDAQAGRLRYDFIQRIDKGKLDFGWQMRREIEAAIDGIDAAIRKGIDLRDSSVKEVEARKQALLAQAGRLDGVKESLARMRTGLGLHE